VIRTVPAALLLSGKLRFSHE